MSTNSPYIRKCLRKRNSQTSSLNWTNVKGSTAKKNQNSEIIEKYLDETPKITVKKFILYDSGYTTCTQW